MKRSQMISICISCFLVSCSTIETDTSSIPRVTTIIDLDKIDKIIETEYIPIRLIYNNEWYSENLNQKYLFIPLLRDMIKGPDSSLYISDFQNCRFVQLSQNGKFIRSIGGPGSGPGEFIEPYGFMRKSLTKIYIPDTYGLRLQVFDMNFDYIRSIKNTAIEFNGFFISPDDKIFYPPPKHIIPQIPYMAIKHDSLGKEITKLAPIGYGKQFVFENNFRKWYSIVADETSNQLWCFFKFFPVIWRFSADGILLEEIKLTSKSITEMLKKRNAILKMHPKPAGVDGGVAILEDPHLHGEGIILNIVLHGNYIISRNNVQSKLIKKFTFTGLPKEIEDRASSKKYWLRFINDKAYGFDQIGIIFAEDRLLH